MDDEQNTRAALQAVLARFIQEASLPDSVAFHFMRWYAGVTGSLAQRAKAANTAPLVGFSGCQGSGKSTLVALMAKVMREVHGVSTVVLSLDDFYLMNSGLVMIQTSLIVLDKKREAMQERNGLLAWHRVRNANAIAKTGPEWAELLGYQNSGTYNNEYMVRLFSVMIV